MAYIIEELGCFIEEELKEVTEKPKGQPKAEPQINEEAYQAIKNKITYKEIAHKEPHMVGAAFSNLDNNFHINKNTRLEDGSIPSFAAVEALVAKGIYSKNFIGKILEDIKSLNVSIGGKGREEKVRMISGAKQQQQGMKWPRQQQPRYQPVSEQQQSGGEE